MAAGLALQAVAIALAGRRSSTPTRPTARCVVPFVMAGTGMALVFAPTANAVLGVGAPEEAGQASGATNAIRELGGVLGVAVLASVFSAHGSYASPQAFTDGMGAALPVGAAVLAVGALVALLVPGRRGTQAEAIAELEDAEPRSTGPARAPRSRRSPAERSVPRPSPSWPHRRLSDDPGPARAPPAAGPSSCKSVDRAPDLEMRSPGRSRLRAAPARELPLRPPVTA